MAILLRIALVLASLATAAGYTNVNGGNLESCSSEGMALTGYTRSGECIDHNDDAGSHHICIDMASTAGGNFCSVTGQPDWCSSKMGCHGNTGSQCGVEHWCVCQWAFARYLERAGGCDKIQGIVCAATNMVAHRAYKERAGNDASVLAALTCLEERCNITAA